MKEISEFLSDNFQFWVVKFSIYLNRRVFVMLWPVLRTFKQKPGSEATVAKFSSAF